VTPDPKPPLGFLLDPATTSVTKTIIPELFQTVRTVGENTQT
jgi:hypothetical protein